jgi:hypothetical protein
LQIEKKRQASTESNQHKKQKMEEGKQANWKR